MNETIITATILTILLIGVMVTLILLVMSVTRLIKALPMIREIVMDREKYIVKMNYSVQESRTLMENLVEQALLEWQVYNINPSTENYMSEKEMTESIQYIIKKVITELTEVSRLKLSVGYPMETEEEMIESIKNRAKLTVLNYTIKQNENIKEEPMKNINSF